MYLSTVGGCVHPDCEYSRKLHNNLHKGTLVDYNKFGCIQIARRRTGRFIQLQACLATELAKRPVIKIQLFSLLPCFTNLPTR